MKRYPFLFVCFSAMFLLATAASKIAQAAVPAEKPVRVLIIDNPGPKADYYHMPTGVSLRNVIRQDKRFDVVLVEDAEVLGTDLPFDYDVILLHFKNYREPKRNAAMKENLARFIDDGGGLFVYHFACGAFEDWSDFEKFSGRIWDRKKPAHDPYGPFTVKLTDKSHPITKVLGDFEISDELYTCLNDSEVPIHVLAEAVSKVDGKPYPMAFVLEKGKGRVFHTTLGHNDKSLSAEAFQTMIRRALLWCGRRELP